MKYMGSKRAMLLNGLGEVLKKQVPDARRFVDLFAGSGAVSIHVARTFAKPVLAFDLQRYSSVLAGAILGRVGQLDADSIWQAWHGRASKRFNSFDVPVNIRITRSNVDEYRKWCAAQNKLPITKAYGGHYFSPAQAVWIDSLRASLPRTKPERTVALAALIQTASKSAAAPGHTAQPFQPTRTAKNFLATAWDMDIVQTTRALLSSLASQFALTLGNSHVADANEAAELVEEGDLVFLDPPYSGVHYSRFYHVLETIATGKCGEVSGVGRYPEPSLRPRSRYSVGSESENALEDLFETLANRGARVILTFPAHVCSNGLSGDIVQDLAENYFRIDYQRVESQLSTLGGRAKTKGLKQKRTARREAKELVLVLSPKSSSISARPTKLVSR